MANLDGRALVGPAILMFCVLVAQLLGGGLSAEVSLGVNVVLALILGFVTWRRASAPRFMGDPLYGALEILFGFVLLASLATTTLAWAFGPIRAASLDPSASFVEMLLLMGLACAFVVGAAFGGSKRKAPVVLYGAVAVTSLLAVWASIAFVLRGEGRLSAEYMTPNTAGTVFGLALVLTLNLLATRLRRMQAGGRRFTALMLAGASAVLGLALLATASRGALLATTAGMIVSLAPQLFRRGGGGQAQVAVLAVASIALLVFAFAGGSVVERLSAPGAQLDARAELFALDYRMFLRSPLTGYGLGTFDLITKMSLDASNFPRLWSIRSAHNVYLQWLVEGGLITALPMFACVALVMLRTGLSALGGGSTGSMLWGLLGADVVVLVHGLSDFALQTPAVAALWAVLLGLQFGLANGERRRRSRASRVPALVLSGATVIGSLLALGSLLFGGGLQLGPVTVAPLAAGYDRAATALMARPDDPRALEKAAVLSRRALSLSPHDTSASLRLAYIDSLGPNGLTAKGERMFARSYEQTALDQAVASWRIRFALENWARLTPATRAAVRHEFEVLVTTRGHRDVLLNTLQQVRKGEGAFVARFWTVRVLREPV